MAIIVVARVHGVLIALNKVVLFSLLTAIDAIL